MQRRVLAGLQLFRTSVRNGKKALRSWSGANPCAWPGVFCEAPYPAFVVAGLDLNGVGLGGKLPQRALLMLPDLGFLHLSRNAFQGAPPDLSGLTKLAELDLSVNRFSGPVPAWPAKLPALRFLDLRHNAFSGPLPSALLDAKLDVLAANHNQVRCNLSIALRNGAGILPESLIWSGRRIWDGQQAACPEVVSPTLKETDAAAATVVPPNLRSSHRHLQVLQLDSNRLSGTLPEAASNLTALVQLDISFNRFVGDIGQSPLWFLPNLKVATCFPALFFLPSAQLVVGFRELHIQRQSIYWQTASQHDRANYHRPELRECRLSCTGTFPAILTVLNVDSTLQIAYHAGPIPRLQ
eukprot:SM000016S01951  [mRNA]  locus=s16:850720:852717:- [translate_table: standard]